MILSVTELRKYVQTNEDDETLQTRLRALETAIRKYTNNNFQRRAFRCEANVTGGVFTAAVRPPFAIGETVQITESLYNDGLYTVDKVDGATFTVKEPVRADETDVLLTLVVYPDDVKMGVANMLKWEFSSRDKVGIASESISRHSVTYFNLDGSSTSLGYPRPLLGFLRPYCRAHFGRGRVL